MFFFIIHCLESLSRDKRHHLAAAHYLTRYLESTKFVSLRGRFKISHPQADKCLLESYFTKIEYPHWIVKHELRANVQCHANA